MSTFPTGGLLSSAAGAPLSQTKGAEAERSAVDSASRDRQADEVKQAEKSSGVGQTEEDQGASDRDADGRRQWEASAQAGETPDDEAASSPPREQQPSKDPTGNSGNQLDLMG